jgi:hypothetical protein
MAMSTSDSKSPETARAFVTGNVEKLIQIEGVEGSVQLFGDEVVDKIAKAVQLQKSQGDDADVRKAVSRVLALLRTKAVLYAQLDNELWMYVFPSMKELRGSLSDAASELGVEGPDSVFAIVDLMAVAIRNYLSEYEQSYELHMQSPLCNTSPAHWEREWPELVDAARGLIALRELLVAAIEPLNAYARQGEEVIWDSESWVRKYELQRDGAAE